MQIIKLTILTLFIALPVFMLSAMDAQAATHECADTVGVCNYVFSSGVKTYKATSVFDKVDQRYEWNCGFGNGQVSCPEEPATSVSPTPTPPPSSGGNTPPTTSKGNQTQAVEGTYLGEEETITKIVDRCPCPTCGDKHYDCIAGKGSTLGASAKNKKETKSQFTGPDGIRRNVTTWTWRCIDSCGNLTGECREEKIDKVGAECDETACANSDDCSKCAKCKVGTPTITTSVDGKCYWTCEAEIGEASTSKAWCSAVKGGKGSCGPAHGTISAWTEWMDITKNTITTWYTNEQGWQSQEMTMCNQFYQVCSKVQKNISGGKEITWYCCPLETSVTEDGREVHRGCGRLDGCSACRTFAPSVPIMTPLDMYKSNLPGGGVTNPVVNPPATTTNTATVGVGVFRPSTWY